MSDMRLRGMPARAPALQESGPTRVRRNSWSRPGMVRGRFAVSSFGPRESLWSDLDDNDVFQTLYSPPPTVFPALVPSETQPGPATVPPEVMAALDAVQDEAREEGYPVPSDALVDDARALLRKVYQVAPVGYAIYPMENGEIAIHASNEPKGAVVITCHPHDTWCVVSIGKSRRRAWFQDMAELPDPFVVKAFRDLCGAVPHR